MPHAELMLGDRILLSRIALLEARVQSLAEHVVGVRDREATDECDPRPSLVIEPDSPLEFARGLHACERDQAGRVFRWAGLDEHFEFRFFIDRRSALPFRLHGMFAPGVSPGALRATADYRPIAVRSTEAVGMVEITGLIPPEPLGNGVTLTFVCPAASMVPGGDVRPLSFAFHRLIVGEDRATPSRSDAAGRRGEA